MSKHATRVWVDSMIKQVDSFLHWQFVRFAINWQSNKTYMKRRKTRAMPANDCAEYFWASSRVLARYVQHKAPGRQHCFPRALTFRKQYTTRWWKTEGGWPYVSVCATTAPWFPAFTILLLNPLNILVQGFFEGLSPLRFTRNHFWNVVWRTMSIFEAWVQPKCNPNLNNLSWNSRSLFRALPKMSLDHHHRPTLKQVYHSF